MLLNLVVEPDKSCSFTAFGVYPASGCSRRLLRLSCPAVLTGALLTRTSLPRQYRGPQLQPRCSGDPRDVTVGLIAWQHGAFASSARPPGSRSPSGCVPVSAGSQPGGQSGPGTLVCSRAPLPLAGRASAALHGRSKPAQPLLTHLSAERGAARASSRVSDSGRPVSISDSAPRCCSF